MMMCIAMNFTPYQCTRQLVVFLIWKSVSFSFVGLFYISFSSVIPFANSNELAV